MLVAAIAASVGAAVAVHVSGRVGGFGDEASHLLHARRVFDSLTPGFAQLGNYWPPLLHMAELPFVWINPLYRSMWAGTLPAMAFYVLAVLAAYTLGVEISRDRRVGALAAFALGANPNLLYLQGSVMLESAIVMGLLWVAVYLVRFSRNGNFRDVVVAGLWTSVAAWTTWAALLLPLYGAAVVVIAGRRKGFEWRKTETMTLAYVVAASYTLILWLGWNFYIQHDVLYTLHYRQPVPQLLSDRAFLHGHPGNPIFAFANYGAAVVALLGPVLTLIIVVVIAAAIVRGRIIHPVGATLAGATLAVAYLFFRGSAIGSPVYATLAGLTSFDARTNNIRYALWLAPFAPAAVALLCARRRGRILPVLVALVIGLVWFVPQFAGVDTLDASTPRRIDPRFMRAIARDCSADRPILMSSINGGDIIIQRTGLNASRFLTEANGALFTSALSAPHKHAGCVVLAPGSTVGKRLTPARLSRAGFVFASSTTEQAPRQRLTLWRAT